MSDIAIISLFAGVGGFDLAGHNLGIPTIAAVEIDDNARGVIAHQFPDTRLYTDVTEVSGKELLGDHQGTVIVTGGFPCQDLSVAGKRAGLGGERSGLFWHIIRIAEEIQPQVILLENVPGLLSSNGGHFGADTLAEILFECESSGGNIEASQSQGQDIAGTLTDGAGTGSESIGGGQAFGQSGFGTYASGVKTLNHSMHRRPEDTVVICG